MSARYDWSKIGLVKKNHVTTFEVTPAVMKDGKIITPAVMADFSKFTDFVKSGLMHSGAYTKLRNVCAGHEKATDEKKREMVLAMYNTLAEGKLTKGKSDVEKESKEIRDLRIIIKTMEDCIADATSSKDEKKMAKVMRIKYQAKLEEILPAEEVEEEE